MAWVATQDFNDLTDGDLLGQAGGSGWTGNWSGTSTTMDVQGTVTYEGAKAVQATANGDGRRALSSSTSSGTMYVAMRSDVTTTTGYTVLEEGSGSGRMYCRFDSGNIQIFDNGTYVTVSTYVANTWYIIGFDFNDAAQNNLYRINVDNGAFSDYKTVNGGTYTSITHVRFERDGTTNTFYWDRISDTYPVVVAPVRSKPTLLMLNVG